MVLMSQMIKPYIMKRNVKNFGKKILYFTKEIIIFKVIQVSFSEFKWFQVTLSNSWNI